MTKEIFRNSVDRKAFMNWKIPDELVDGTGYKKTTKQPDPLHKAQSENANSTPAQCNKLDRRKKSDSSAVKEQNKMPKASELMKNSDTNERRIIAKQLLLNRQKYGTQSTLAKTLRPEVKEEMEKWLESATPKERENALTMLQALLEKKECSKDDIRKIFDKENSRGDEQLMTMSHPVFTKPESTTNLKVIRLLSPDSRANRWLHSTWHHMPPYLDKNPNMYQNSHYVTPQRPIPRHYKYHPDMID